MAYKQTREKSETITKTERHRRAFHGWIPFEIRRTSRYQEYFAESRGFREPSYALFLGLGFLASDSNAAQNTPSSRILQGISYFFAGFLFTVSKIGKWPLERRLGILIAFSYKLEGRS